MEAILVDHLQTVGQLARQCINLLEVKTGVRANALEPPLPMGLVVHVVINNAFRPLF